jgi:hypothetical protein
MEIYIDMYGLVRPAVKCECGRIMEYVGYDDEPCFCYVHRCSGCNKYHYIEENFYELMWNIITRKTISNTL